MCKRGGHGRGEVEEGGLLSNQVECWTLTAESDEGIVRNRMYTTELCLFLNAVISILSSFQVFSKVFYEHNALYMNCLGPCKRDSTHSRRMLHFHWPRNRFLTNQMGRKILADMQVPFKSYLVN